MTTWDFLDKLTGFLPPIVALVLAVIVVVVLIIGFSKYGLNFIKYGFKQTALDESLEQRINDIGKSLESLHTELNVIKVNHFGHLKGYLEILDGILLDKEIISNKDKAMLDNQLKGMYSSTDEHK
jgi:hypothetical protein